MIDLKALTPAQSQAFFAVYLRSLSEPGRIGQLPYDTVPPVASGPLVLADLLAPIAALDETAADLVASIATATGASVVEPSKARIAVACEDADGALLELLNTATAFNPHTACLLIQRVKSLNSDPMAPGIALELSGPGVQKTTTLAVDGVTESFVNKRNKQCSDFPRGFDLYFVTDSRQVAGIPRSTTVAVGVPSK